MNVKSWKRFVGAIGVAIGTLGAVACGGGSSANSSATLATPPIAATAVAGVTVVRATAQAGSTVVSGTAAAGATTVSGTAAAGATTVSGTVTTGATAVSGTVVANATTVRVVNSSIGPVLADARGMTLYTYSKDTSGISTVSGNLAAAWPPYILQSGQPTKPTEAAGSVTVIDRSDGSKQVAYNNQPLYGWQGDKNAGDTSGQNVAGFVVAKP